jgi:hypothetical protein
MKRWRSVRPALRSGVLAQAIRPPTCLMAPPDCAPVASHTHNDLQHAAAMLADARAAVGVLPEGKGPTDAG